MDDGLAMGGRREIWRDEAFEACFEAENVRYGEAVGEAACGGVAIGAGEIYAVREMARLRLT